ncbi:dienelactone hydrolase [Thioalkalivibrio denitrificans]|uniref:Dienelactone hydrolase n=1 Tax=Thioalkalivibrio denitrificans TaxID=108003 RepID=A0A1V3NUM6_9GAMM|nr:dienelactone hydrolase family protein [Thioalkalivibrio denitrificans]OOG28731.1 dienelactone hydrolase [Thioalkalivibrio denitrificans]
MRRITGWLFVGCLFAGMAATQAGEMHDWWDDAWWERGELAIPENHAVAVTRDSYLSGDVEVPVMIARPDDDRKYPAVLFAHGRRGLDNLTEPLVTRLAARGFVVVAPDLYTGRFISAMPIEHDYVLEEDLNLGLDFLLARDDISSSRACVYSHTRGGYYALKVAVTFERQERDLACYVSYYPHMQDPNAPEPMQVYRYASEVDDLTLPTLVFVGEHEQYQRKRGIEMSITALRNRDRPAQLVVYPGVGRAFDFRPTEVRTFADDLAAKDAVQRAARFMRQHLE